MDGEGKTVDGQFDSMAVQTSLHAEIAKLRSQLSAVSIGKKNLEEQVSDFV